MDITISTGDNEQPEVTLVGRFDAFETETFRAALDELIAAPSKSIRINLADVQFIDSSALAELVRGMKHCREAGGELVLHQLSDPVRVILELTRLDAAFEITGTD